jgi:hypothetical protein
MSNRVETDAEELKGYISKFFADKANEFTVQMKQNMDSLMEKKITNYYEDFDSEPFKDFVVGILDTYNHQYIFSINSYIVKSDGNPHTHTIKHNLTPHMLQSIKIIFNGTGLHTLNWALPTHDIFKKMIQNPKYFMTNCAEFEETCKKEYALIKEQKQELARLIKEEIKNQEYYSELEKKIEQVEFKERMIERERQKIHEERARLLAVKQKLDLMKQELQLERDAFEKEKKVHDIKNIDLDDYFQIPVATVVATKVTPTIGETILGEYADL